VRGEPPAAAQHGWRRFVIGANWTETVIVKHGLQPSRKKGTDYKSAPASASSTKSNPHQPEGEHNNAMINDKRFL
jgi:hypothetical protein